LVSSLRGHNILSGFICQYYVGDNFVFVIVIIVMTLLSIYEEARIQKRGVIYL
jgi:hypothetical protein